MIDFTDRRTVRMYNDGANLTPTVRAWGLTKTFGSGDVMTTALRDVCIDLYPGQLALLMGPSGSGTGVREASQRADYVLDLLGMTRKAHLRPNQLSGGEKQRVAIGRALIKEPAFCFADEPTAALDWKHGEQVIELLRVAAHDNGSTILVVAHDARMIPHVDRVFHLEDGVLVEGAEKPLAAFGGRAVGS